MTTQLRYVMRDEPRTVENLAGGLVQVMGKVKVLQWREFAGHTNPNGAYGPEGEQWTDWQDVPVVGDKDE